MRSIVLCILLCLASTAAALAQPTPPAEYTEALGIAMEGWPYPHPVRFLPLVIEGRDLRMAYMDVKPSAADTGRAVVLLHGKNFSGGYWQNTIAALSSAGFRVIVPDQIGFGKSSKPEIHYSFDLLAANTVKLLDELKIERVAVVGHSMGGMLAARFARNHPQRTTHLILENPIGLEDYRMKVPPAPIEQLVAAETKKTAADLRKHYQSYFVTWKPEYERYVEAPARIKLSGEFPRYARVAALTYQMIYQQPVRHEFPLIRTPTLLVIGQVDHSAIGRGMVSEEVLKTLGQFPRLGKEAAKDIPGAKLVELENVGHLPHVEAPQRFHAPLIEFLER
jgi:pimeloyl-ACP methyl ester carboxylesterase